jgi:hypothetical protein
MARSKSPNSKKQKDIVTEKAVAPVPAVQAAAPEAPKTQPPVKSETRTQTRKPAAVKAEPRPSLVPANLVPINLEEEVRRRAYELSERRGFAAGYETEDWLSAEREVRQRYHQQQQSA